MPTADASTPDVDWTRFRFDTYNSKLAGLWHDCNPTALVTFVTGKDLAVIVACARDHVCQTKETP